MSGLLRRRRLRGWAYAGLALYFFFLLTSQLEHHDFSCELRTPQHCPACTSTVLGTDPTDATLSGLWQLADAGTSRSLQILATDLLLTVRSTGRSPPPPLG